MLDSSPEKNSRAGEEAFFFQKPIWLVTWFSDSECEIYERARDVDEGSYYDHVTNEVGKVGGDSHWLDGSSFCDSANQRLEFWNELGDVSLPRAAYYEARVLHTLDNDNSFVSRKWLRELKKMLVRQLQYSIETWSPCRAWRRHASVRQDT